MILYLIPVDVDSWFHLNNEAMPSISPYTNRHRIEHYTLQCLYCILILTDLLDRPTIWKGPELIV